MRDKFTSPEFMVKQSVTEGTEWWGGVRPGESVSFSMEYSPNEKGERYFFVILLF